MERTGQTRGNPPLLYPSKLSLPQAPLCLYVATIQQTWSDVAMNDRIRLLKELMNILEDELGTAPEGVSEDTFLRESLGLDSVDMITVISRVEQAYKIRLNHEELTQMNKVSDIINVILNKTSATPIKLAA